MPDPTPLTDDDQRMIRIQGGDARAFDELVDKYQGPLMGFFFRNTRDTQTSEDLTQETLLRVFNQSWNYLPSGRFRGWMFRIGRNLLIDSIRRQSHDALIKVVTGKTDDDSDVMARLVGEVLSPGEKADHRELARIVDELLKSIPEEQRLTFTMHHFSGLTLSEVAEAMEASLPTCKSRLRLAREKLRGMLKKRGITDPNNRP